MPEIKIVRSALGILDILESRNPANEPHLFHGGRVKDEN